MSSKLVAENIRLRKQLDEFLEQAHRNQQIMRRNQSLELEFIGAETFSDLIGSLFHAFADADLDVISLCLLDPDYDIRRILAELDVDLHVFPNLMFFEEASEMGDLHRHLQRPLLGPCSAQLHGPMFPEPMPLPASVAIVPLIRNDVLVGCLNLGSFEAERFGPNMATDFIEHRAQIVAICLENVINKELLKHIGLIDPLTRVNNRRYIERRLAEEVGRSLRHGQPLSCMFIDIDFFKKINDKSGHQAGDEVLREVAARIKAELRLSDALGRFGGEEFLVLLIDAAHEDAASVAERIRASIAEPALILNSGERMAVSVSIGIASMPALPLASRNNLAQNNAENAAKKLVAAADQALYRAKAGGRNRVVYAE